MLHGNSSMLLGNSSMLLGKSICCWIHDRCCLAIVVVAEHNDIYRWYVARK